MRKLIVGAGVCAVVFAMWVGVMWAIWSLWCWALPQVYASGPRGLIAPGFWLFAACWTLLTLIGRAIFGRSESK